MNKTLEEVAKSRKIYLEAARTFNELQKALRKKHSSKVYKGLCKMCLRQDKKPSTVTIELPQYNNLPQNFKGDYIHCFTVDNNKWNGMNLKTLCTQTFYRVGYFKSAFQINYLTGKYSLTREGQQKLKRIKERKLK